MSVPVKRVRHNAIALLHIYVPESVKEYFPQKIIPTQLWVNYNPHADSLTVYFTDKPVPSVWEDIEGFFKTARLGGEDTLTLF